jgi:hypothetical protein
MSPINRVVNDYKEIVLQSLVDEDNDATEDDNDVIEDEYFMKIHKERENEAGIPLDEFMIQYNKTYNLKYND